MKSAGDKCEETCVNRSVRKSMKQISVEEEERYVKKGIN